ncbi:histidine kinase [Amycolatopsis cynarae]|uniref:histidine kinase n=1 Tax=Amycolatopsis cynarae TaxID=2995223 RepID=A0ABY7B123_9PSEU|nr:ATP-binding protein [Amycolatopsis sp. HUAS 11-8]WAL65388.1 histidine kinase [Amycolatopsis sp. HUAS 11-8]
MLVEIGFLLLLLVQVVRRLPLSRAWPVGVSVFVAVTLIPMRFLPAFPTFPPLLEIAGFCCGTAFLAGCALSVGIYLRWLDETAVRAVRWARREQRRQLERDVHDWLAHEVTAIVLEAQAAQLSECVGGEAGTALRRIEEAGVRALESMDRAIRLLRRENGLSGEMGEGCLRGFRELPELIARFDRVGSTRAELFLEEGVEARPEIEDVGYRVVLESLTNVRRHAATATRLLVAVRQEGAAVMLTVTDDGRPGRSASVFRRRNGGAGLASLAERVHALGGAFRAGPGEAGGWRVQAVLPLDGG